MPFGFVFQNYSSYAIWNASIDASDLWKRKREHTEMWNAIGSNEHNIHRKRLLIYLLCLCLERKSIRSRILIWLSFTVSVFEVNNAFFFCPLHEWDKMGRNCSQPWSSWQQKETAFENESIFFDKYCSKIFLFSTNSLMGRLTKSNFGQWKVPLSYPVTYVASTHFVCPYCTLRSLCPWSALIASSSEA